MFWAAVTAVLAAWGWFALLLQITGAIAVVQVIPATLLFFRYRWLRAEPLPTPRPANTRRLPRPVRRPGPRCRRWVPPSADSSRCWV
ncbi:putative alanine rich transmembrane protein [Mycobacterium kansasii]|uniref:Putative alanine rich transmembrane protein n=1 Tax=Mycobacterium kansasii TaxID=1768 RepID=A0A1V3XWI1_MYCKA|nr:putative alanine rich transmembrane protein [Mycobacterium kansasii]